MTRYTIAKLIGSVIYVIGILVVNDLRVAIGVVIMIWGNAIFEMEDTK